MGKWKISDVHVIRKGVEVVEEGTQSEGHVPMSENHPFWSARAATEY